MIGPQWRQPSPRSPPAPPKWRGSRRNPSAASFVLDGRKEDMPMADDPTARGTRVLFLAERADRLMRTAVLLTGSHDAGQDLLQTALERLIRHWRRLDGDPEGYLRRTLYNLATDGFRRRGRLQRKLLLLKTGTQPLADPIAEVDLRDALVRLMISAARPAAGSARPPVLGTAERGRDRAGTRLAGRHSQVDHRPGAAAAARSSPRAGTSRNQNWRTEVGGKDA